MTDDPDSALQLVMRNRTGRLAFLLAAFLSTANAQYVDTSVGSCGAVNGYRQIALDAPLVYFVDLPAKAGGQRKIMRVDLVTGAVTVLRVLDAAVTGIADGYQVFAVVPTNSAELYVADVDNVPGRYAIYRSTDGGQSWMNVRGNISDCMPAVIVSPDGGVVSYTKPCGSDAGRSLDHGITWTYGPIKTGNQVVAFSLADTSKAYRINTSVIERTADRGASWSTAAMRGYNSNLATVLRADGVDANTLYAVTGGNSGIHFQISRNGGDDWTQVPSDPAILTLVASANQSGVLYFYDYIATKAIYRSADFGQSWVPLVYGNGVTATCNLRATSMLVGASGVQGTPIYPDAALLALFDAARTVPGDAAIVVNDYGALTVTGANYSGTAITHMTGDASIELGPIAGAAGSALEIDFDGLNLGLNKSLTIRSGAPGQTVILTNVDGAPSTIAGALRTEGAGGIPAPALIVQNRNGITVKTSGVIDSKSGLTTTALGSTWQSGNSVVNEGIIDGGLGLAVRGSALRGGGAWLGDVVVLSTFGHANNPIHGAYYLDNSLQLAGSSGGYVALALNAFGSSPQYLNVKINGSGSVTMPTSWGPGSAMPPNNTPIPEGGNRPSGVGEPPFGGGSMIVQATSELAVLGGYSNDFAFPGGIVLSAGSTLDLGVATINQGWTTAGRAFQGLFFESPNIVATSTIRLLTNSLNWTNFSTLPKQRVRVSSLQQLAGGSAGYLPADAVAPHINTYSVLIDAAANGQCWTCLQNTQAIDMSNL